MWRPRALGRVIAQRTLRFERRHRRPRSVSVVFGCPLRAPRPLRGDPWWCPVEVVGLGKRRLETIAGEDSLQALILAVEFVRRVLPMEAERAGGRLQSFGDHEDLVFANTVLLGLAERGLQNCIKGLAEAVAVLENNGARDRGAAKTLAGRFRALIASGGYTADPRRAPPPSNRPFERAGTNPRRPSKRASAGRSTPLR